MIWHSEPVKSILQHFETDEQNGLTHAQAKERLAQHGPNCLEQKKKKSLASRFLAQFNDYMVIILLIAAGMSFFVSFAHGHADLAEPIIILAIVVLNATIGVLQETKAERALEALKQMTAATTQVMREGRVATVSSADLVPGDIILLQSGDFVPADARILSSVECQADESSLTGESLAVAKNEKTSCPPDAPIADQHNMLWASTSITNGRATAVVVATGMQSQMGKIATLILTGETPQTPLQHKLAKTGEALGTVALLICAVLFTMGVARKVPPLEMFMTSISLAVAAIPEGLPAIVTIMLALGVQKMTKQNAIVRKLPAVETLGSASVICSDKTGTLTQNKMTVMETYGDGDLALTLACLCSNNSDATEAAILHEANKRLLPLEETMQRYPRVKEIPFSSTRKRMTTIHKTPEGMYRVVVKGAPDVLLGLCKPSPTVRAQMEQNSAAMGKRALRVLGVAFAQTPTFPLHPEQNLEFVGLIGMMDPPRPEVKEAVFLCKTAGIRPVMITGDHIETACAVARDIGLLQGEHQAVTGAKLDEMDDYALQHSIEHYRVFARVTPEHKVRIVEAYQKQGHVVAMTGDGVNDAPALQKADIGCAMGITGTDVAKGAADMVLTDDNFATIVQAVRHGRGIYDNIRKAVHFLLSSNIGEIITIFAAMLMGWPTPLVAIQLLWVNLVTDSLPAIALGLDATADDVMTRKPVNRRKSLFADGLAGVIFMEGVMIGVLALFAFAIGNTLFESVSIGRTMSFCVLALSQLVHSFNVRTEHSVLHSGLKSNPLVWLSLLLGTLLQGLVVTVPALASLFGVVALSTRQWGYVAALAMTPLFAVETAKLLSALWGKQEKVHNSSLSYIK